MNTRKYPRTLVEAFGPYAHGSQLTEHSTTTHTSDRIVLTASAAVLIALLAIALAGWL